MKNYRVIISGGIGSGKSMVAERLKLLGAKVYSADKINANLLTSPEYVSQIAAYFPQTVSQHGIDKDILSKLIYENEDKRQLLMSLSHPIIYREFDYLSQGKSLAFFEVSVFPVVGFTYDELWIVKADAETRINRVKLRSGYTEERIRKIIQLQGTIAERGNVHIIDNNGSEEELQRKVDQLYRNLLKKLGL